MNVRPLKRADLEWADILMISSMDIQQPSLEYVLGQATDMQRNGKKIRTAVGGPLITTRYHGESSLGRRTDGIDDLSNNIDHLFVGEAEVTLPEFLRDLETGETKKFYVTREFPDIASTPLPDFKLINPRDYATMAVQYSRGCPGRCDFCSIPTIYGRIPRVKTNEQMIKELDHLYGHGWEGTVFIVDDNFIGNKPSVKQLLPEIAEWQRKRKYPYSLFTQASMNLADDEDLLREMRDAGFKSVFLGIETPDKDTLEAMGKYQNAKRDLLDSVRKIQSYGMEVMGGFIVGHDSDPEDVIERQREFIETAGIPQAMVGLLNIIPLTILYEKMEREGRMLQESDGNNTHNDLNFKTKRNPQTIKTEYQELMGDLYLPKNYYGRCLTLLRHLDSSRNGYKKITADDIRALLNSMWIQGVRDSERMEYWRFLGKSLLQYPERFKDAVALAIKGYHFRRITEQYTSQT
ncbi:DUF4070 domain-containing protein [archaeon]|nr:DUF4070 domain-containing protein [archaeon]